MIKKTITVSFLLLIMILSGCKDNKVTENQNDLNPLWNYEQDLLDRGSVLPIDDYNQSIEKALSMRMPWVYSPISIALRVAGQQMISPEVNLVAKSLSGNELITHAVVIIEKKGLLDDSLADEYYRVELKLGGSIWQVSQVSKAWKCRENRGHQEISAKPCG